MEQNMVPSRTVIPEPDFRLTRSKPLAANASHPARESFSAGVLITRILKPPSRVSQSTRIHTYMYDTFGISN